MKKLQCRHNMQISSSIIRFDCLNEIFLSIKFLRRVKVDRHKYVEKMTLKMKGFVSELESQILYDTST